MPPYSHPALRGALFAALVALCAAARVAAAPVPGHLLATGSDRITLAPRATADLGFDYPDRLVEHLTSAEAREFFSWRVISPRAAGVKVRFYWHYRGYRTIGIGASGSGSVPIRWALYVENLSTRRVVLEIRYRLVDLRDGGYRI